MPDKAQLMEILKKINCEEIVIEGNLEDESEEYEIEIIEEYEEVGDGKCSQEGDGTVHNSSEEEIQNHSTNDISENNVRETPQDQGKRSVDSDKGTSKIVQYDATEDWEDEELENTERTDLNSAQIVYVSNSREEAIRKCGYPKSNKRILSELNASLQTIRDANVVMESSTKKPRMAVEFENNHEVINDDSQNEVMRTEEDVVYTILEPKKANYTNMAVDNGHKDHLDEEDSVPVEGTIYYEGDNETDLYVTQSTEDGEQYQFNNITSASNESEWENSQQSIEQQQYENCDQGQIFLHEDEDGQLYFKDENGTLQPVYLTEDGNYAIAGNSSDEQDSQESHTAANEINQSGDNDNYIIPDLDVKSASSKQSIIPVSNIQEPDNEDSTLTISLIISEDENGQKKTQVIIPTAENLKCEICHKTFKTSFQLLKHNRLKHAREEDITTRNFPCDLCPKRFPDQNSLARHRKTHTGDRPFQCLECQKTFPTAATLRRHLTLHNPESRPLPCIYCGRRFMEKASLVKHEQSHLGGENKNHTSDIGHKNFAQAADLALHKKNHDPDRKFDCEVCGREFNRLNNLQRHMMVHQQQGANEEILACEVCGITYKFMSSLTRHMVTTHVNPEKMRQQAEEQRRKRESNYRRYLENRKMYETQNPGTYTKRSYHKSLRLAEDNEDEV